MLGSELTSASFSMSRISLSSWIPLCRFLLQIINQDTLNKIQHQMELISIPPQQRTAFQKLLIFLFYGITVNAILSHLSNKPPL